jgi:hypothetical protein
MWHRSAVVSNGHERSIEPQVNDQMAPAAILDVEEVRSSILLAPTSTNGMLHSGSGLTRQRFARTSRNAPIKAL